jgi:flagellar basal-body rod protein FlgB
MQMNTPISEELGRYLSLSRQQLTLTAANMANIDTPGYRTQGLDFAGEMRRSLSEENSAAEPGRVFEVDGLLERPDGNNVSMDREGLAMAQAQLQFRTGVELLKREFTRLADAIHEDK